MAENDCQGEDAIGVLAELCDRDARQALGMVAPGDGPWVSIADHYRKYARAIIEAYAARLRDPATVHANMLHGTIAKISMDQCAHTHGVQFNDLEAAEAKLADQAAEILSLKSRVEELEERLEITWEWHSDPEDPDGFVKVAIPPDQRTLDYDGIFCRDETIKLQDDRILSLTQERDRLREALAPFASIPPVTLSEGHQRPLYAAHYWCVIGSPDKTHFTREDLARASAALQKEPPMPRNLTPLHLRCHPSHCPSIHELDDGSLLIVGKSATMAAACEHIPVGEGEHAVIVSGELLGNVVPGWKTIDQLTDDIIWGKRWLLSRQGFEVTLAQRMQLGPGSGYREVWWEVGGGEIEFEPTHFMACPLPPAEKVEA